MYNALYKQGNIMLFNTWKNDHHDCGRRGIKHFGTLLCNKNTYSNNPCRGAGQETLMWPLGPPPGRQLGNSSYTVHKNKAPADYKHHRYLFIKN